MAMQCTDSPLFGVWTPQKHLNHLYYGAGCVEKHLLSTLPSSSSKVFILTGASISAKTPLIQRLEGLLGKFHAGTYTGIKQHGQAEGVDEATELVAQTEAVDTILSVGGGSPIDSAKTVCFRIHERTGKLLTHITIPTTLSAAECTAGGGFTRSDGTKVGFMHPSMGVATILYDASFARFTPQSLWLSTGMRAVDHAVETMYHPNASEMPWKALALWSAAGLAEGLPQSKLVHGSDDGNDVTTKLQLAAFASSGLRGSNFRGGMGLSHSLGHALGSPYGIPHGETSCLTLAPVIRHKAENDTMAATQLARLLPAMGGQRRCGSDLSDALEVAQRVEDLVVDLGLAQPTLSARGVDREQARVIAAEIPGEEAKDLILGLVEGLF
ncbi:alcohol dehydrogenase [Ilyonectria robusta]|uniref:alcohol dehydrogenase n=1 Tax=Ilyonectria robusta TaxID=1079257 RepID=UPI001E8E73D7|nr:alcohol dehydrogenase [Ilyonectria robusta]KAH8736558.1 alcohol dehydrogenase [Ilyonectria robusta]